LPADAMKAMIERTAASVPMGRMGQNSEIANAVLFLASDDSTFMTGHELVVDGGWSAF
jgi:NAD(P)-dependent dehydrogenase (short-subunit alcohol dehydrogenase family)